MAFKSIFDGRFKYRNSLSTDIRQTFERIRREQRSRNGRTDTRRKVVATVDPARAHDRDSA
jgi:hypothetical protein